MESGQQHRPPDWMFKMFHFFDLCKTCSLMKWRWAANENGREKNKKYEDEDEEEEEEEEEKGII